MTKTAKTSSKKSKSTKKDNTQKAGFGLRAISGICIAVLTVGLIWLGRVPATALIAVLAGLAAVEWARMVVEKNKGYTHQAAGGLAFLCVFCVPVAAGMLQLIMLVIAAAMALYMHAKFRGIDLDLDRLGIVFGYICFGMATAAALIHYQGKMVPGNFNDMVFLAYPIESMKWVVLGLFGVTWLSDTMAYIFGKFIGGPKLAPKLSPNKTIAGLIGSMVGASGVLLVLWRFKADVVYVDVQLWQVLVCGAILGVIGQVGDLAISRYKRFYDVKDTGALIPGHGGVLDRMDAFILIAPAYYFVFLNLV